MQYIIDSYADAVRLLGDYQPVAKELKDWGDALSAYHRGEISDTAVSECQWAALNAIRAMRSDNGRHTGKNFKVSGAWGRALEDEIFPPGCHPLEQIAA